jgi:uncharacterized protein (DUF111 family)
MEVSRDATVRGGLRAMKVDVVVPERESEYRTWQSIRGQLEAGPLAAAVWAVRVKVAHRDGRIVKVMPEFEDLVALAETAGVATVIVLADVEEAARRAGFVRGRALGRRLAHASSTEESTPPENATRIRPAPRKWSMTC